MSFGCIHRILPWNRTHTVQSSSEIKSINLVRSLLTCCRYTSVISQVCIADWNILKYSLLWQCVRSCVICVQVYNKAHEKKGIENTKKWLKLQEMLCFGLLYKLSLVVYSHPIIQEGTSHPYSPHYRFAAQTCQITKSQAFETKYYDHPVSYMYHVLPMYLVFSSHQ